MYRGERHLAICIAALVALAGAVGFSASAPDGAGGSFEILGLEGFVWSDGLTESMSINSWVAEESAGSM